MLEPTVRRESEAPEAPPANAGRQRAADRALDAVSRVPPLARMALVAAVFELALARVGWHGLSDALDLEVLRELHRLARFPRTLAAIAALVSVCGALFAFLRHTGWAPIGRRLVVAAFSGVFVPAMVVATVMPAATLRSRLVVFGLAAANVLVTLVSVTAVRYRAGLATRIAVGAVAATCLVSLSVVGLSQLVQAEVGFLAAIRGALTARPTTTQSVLMAMRHVGEVAWMIVPLAAAWTIVQRGDADTRRWRIGATVALSVLAAAGVLAFRALVGHRFRLVLFGAFRLGLFADDHPWVYALPLGVGAGVGLLALARKDPALQQLGLGAMLWLCGGYAPHTPIQLCYLVLAGMLLTRGAHALDKTGPWRMRQPWAALLHR